MQKKIKSACAEEEKMGRRSVAVLDLRSSEVTVLVGERGVNRTFVFNASHTEPYDGYEAGAFYNAAALKEAVMRCIESVEKTMNERIRKLYIGVPGEFTLVVPREQKAGYSSKRKITARETEALAAGGESPVKGYRFLRATSMIFITADNRRVVSPVGLVSTSLSGLFSYFYATEYFVNAMEKLFEGTRIALSYLPAEYAEAVYLIPEETRDEYCLFLDTGYLSATIGVICGGGVMAQKTAWVGRGQIVARIMQAFGFSYDVSCEVLKRANLYVKTGVKQEFDFRGEVIEYDPAALSEIVKEGLDDFCEAISGFLEECSGRELDYKPLYFTGEGVTEIRGALEHISKRINRICEVLSPDLPYYNRPSMSSRIALVDMAYEDSNSSNGFFGKLFNTFGG